jgi:prepilin-type processing-associated H-X9-DG protein
MSPSRVGGHGLQRMASSLRRLLARRMGNRSTTSRGSNKERGLDGAVDRTKTVRVSVRSARHSSPSQSVRIGVGWMTDMRGKACLFFDGHVGKEGSLDGHVDAAVTE